METKEEGRYGAGRGRQIHSRNTTRRPASSGYSYDVDAAGEKLQRVLTEAKAVAMGVIEPSACKYLPVKLARRVYVGVITPDSAAVRWLTGRLGV